jgi:Spy/CpxP family protein refolding chaperone
MKSWIKKSLFTVFGASIALGGLTACSSARPWHHDASPEQMAQMQGKMVERIGSKLDLNAEQKQKLQTLTDVLLAQRKAMVGVAGDPRSQVQALVAGERFDRSAAQSLLDEKTRAVQAGGPAVIAALGDFYDSLQPAQQQKVRDMMQRRRGWMASHG